MPRAEPPPPRASNVGAISGTVDLLQRCYPGLETGRTLVVALALTDGYFCNRLPRPVRGRSVSLTGTEPTNLPRSAALTTTPSTLSRPVGRRGAGLTDRG